jgi:hypothetical protein
MLRDRERAFKLAESLVEDGGAGYLIERAMDEARSYSFRPIGEPG